MDHFQLVENSLSVDSLELTDDIRKEKSLSLRDHDGLIARIDFAEGVSGIDRFCVIELEDGPRQRFHLIEVQNNYGPVYYFVCQERAETVRKLYLPPQEDEFRCFDCHDTLRYESRLRSGVDEYEDLRRWEKKCRKILKKLDLEVPRGVNNLPAPENLPRLNNQPQERFIELRNKYEEYYQHIRDYISQVAEEERSKLADHQERVEELKSKVEIEDEEAVMRDLARQELNKEDIPVDFD